MNHLDPSALEALMPELLDRLRADVRADPLMTTLYVCSAASIPSRPYTWDHYYCFEDFHRLSERLTVLIDQGFIWQTGSGGAVQSYHIKPALLYYLSDQ